MKSLIIRLILAVWVCYGVYGEAGKITAFAFLWMYVMCELNAKHLRDFNKIVNVILSMIVRIKRKDRRGG